MSLRFVLSAVATTVLAGSAAPALAGDYYYHGGCGPSYVYYDAPVYYAPAPVYYAPPPVYYAPRYVHYRSYHSYPRHYRHYDRGVSFGGHYSGRHGRGFGFGFSYRD